MDNGARQCLIVWCGVAVPVWSFMLWLLALFDCMPAKSLWMLANMFVATAPIVLLATAPPPPHTTRTVLAAPVPLRRTTFVWPTEPSSMSAPMLPV